jgi:hypothetical protein
MRMFSRCVIAALLAAMPATADEVWKTDLGEIMWETDYDGGAIFRIDTGKGKLVRFYIEGLEPTGAPRGHFDGFWISTSDEGLCSAELAGPDGTRSRTWGRVSLTFVDKEFPSDWTALTGECMGEPHEVMTGRALTS